jgi:hypothetical protein
MSFQNKPYPLEENEMVPLLLVFKSNKRTHLPTVIMPILNSAGIS